MLRLVAIVFCVAALSGCGSSVDEKPPLKEGEGGPTMSQEDVQKAMQESMKMGGRPGKYAPGAKASDSGGK